MTADVGSQERTRFTFDAPFDIAPSLFRFEPPDIVLVHISRAPAPAELEALKAFFREAGEHIGGAFSMTNMAGDVKPFSVSSALEMNRELSKGMVKASAVVGGSYHMRVFAETLIRAARALKLDIAGVPVRFFLDEASARAWFDEVRRASQE